ncbi:predicted protein [Naegleria gruberi]|uniref:EGF domain-specific O-linked N-acetylglucosamine transferase n=1 Tax=Naegleria gruberi TaxID=5762 RepID=D2VXE8_NAEGR|nr:uncharacterized protein NAEGRDRAFT_73723 [Naegleria gruberi]EFC38497.1 predicted protein [Naegleria gruberi]|eukprot:XP_002671241.1 predicted protein [Naegleria gruberi strain NEG-M]
MWRKLPQLICSEQNMKNSSLFERSQDRVCYDEYDCGLLRKWKEKPLIFCGEEETITEPPKSKFQLFKNIWRSSGKGDYKSNLVCYNFNNKHLPGGTKPHTVCKSQNLIIDFSKLVHAECLRYRPNYFCKKPTYYNYNRGALIGNCKFHDSRFNLDYFSKDFGKDIFSSFRSVDDLSPNEKLRISHNDVEIVTGTTLFIFREQDEHVNLFHAISDFYAGYLILEMFQTKNQKLQVVLMDEHYEGFVDFLWNHTLSVSRPVVKASHFKGRPVRFENALFASSGYATPLFSSLKDFAINQHTCHSQVELIRSFADMILSGLNIKKRRAQQGDLIKILFISRKPYQKDGVDHQYMARQITNEDDVVNAIKKHSRSKEFEVKKVDFVHYSLKEQIELVHNSDFLIGFHGAGLTHTFFLPEGTSALLEIWNSPRLESWRCFEQITRWKGNAYHLWTNQDFRALEVNNSGDYLRIEIPSFMWSFNVLLDELVEMRQKHLR